MKNLGGRRPAAREAEMARIVNIAVAEPDVTPGAAV